MNPIKVLQHDGSRSMIRLDNGPKALICCLNDGKYDDWGNTPAMVEYSNGRILYYKRYCNGKLHCYIGAAVVRFNFIGEKEAEDYYIDGAFIQTIRN